jgi:two-component system sensor histidine kinase/response regulator
MSENEKKILIVDDSITNLRVIEKMLERDRMKVTFSYSGREALELLNNGYLPDLILLDIMMPGMNGFSFKRKLNETEKLKNIPVIVISALQEQESKSIAFDLGCVDFMVKPINKQEVLHRIKVQFNFKQQQIRLNEINKELEESNKTRDKIFSIISHDLRTSVGNIRNVFKFMIDGLIDPNEDKDLILDAEISSRNTFNLLDNLLYWAKSQQGTLAYNPESVSLSRTISTLLDMEKGSIVIKNLEIIESVPDDLFVWSDKVLLTISLKNLIANAIKFTPENGRISLIGQAIDGKVKLSIVDTGAGISEKNLQLIKDGKSFTTPGTNNEKGTGLGLALVKDCMRICNGKLEVKSKAGSGSEFSLYLPIEDSEID